MNTSEEERCESTTEELRRPNYKDCHGVRIPAGFSRAALESVLNYKPQAGELFVVTYPKCGTTWMQYIVLLIKRTGRPVTDMADYLRNSPFLEMTGAEAVQFMNDPGAIKLHLPFELTPFSADAKYIYVARNPNDCCVSFYHHTKMIPVYNFADGTFDEFFDLFVKGRVDFGDYFDHHLSWYRRRHLPNVHFVTYERLKSDTERQVLEIAKFMGDGHYQTLANNPRVLADVLKYSGVNYMKSTLNHQFHQTFGVKKEIGQNLPSGVRYLLEYKARHPSLYHSGQGEFVRKGIVGDWKNYLSPEQERRMRDRIREKTTGTGLMDLWKNCLHI